ncbi:WD repeat-containing protein on Y chromosome-like [Orussus abietinus]|uniref:WD repeat-containing protein on Y chromosome-like n=1 Tax=Orussus abietinus TaxID=222816 RepID=UPI000C716233|nr:WD repeat-containing protein on Y chromosome-like [Orussus abietinus]
MAKKFDLRVMISNFDEAITTMSYYFNVDAKEDSYLILGDMAGTIRVMFFNPTDKGPFKPVPEKEMLHLHYNAILRGEFKSIKMTEFRNVHSTWVSQVGYFESLRAFISCARCSECSALVSDPSGSRIKYKFKVPLGITCFSFCEEKQMLVTGGPDCTVRTWNPFVPKKASNIFRGHHAGVCALIVHDAGRQIYSLAKDKCIKVWDVSTQICIQTYNGLPSELGEQTAMSVVYNPVTHKMIIASMVIAILVCEQVINQENSDGFSHTKPVTCVLYNHLFKEIVTTGADSCIITWDPWLGRRLYLVTNAHNYLFYGQFISVEITAACFDSSEQLLLTGARDGSLKIWNFNTGTCIRSLIVESDR